MTFREKEKEKRGGGLVPPPPRPFPRRPFPFAPSGRSWLKIDAKGNSQIVAMDRHRLTHELGVQTRDLRILDPTFSTNYQSAILCREKALVVNLLHIKAIVTTDCVLVMNPDGKDGELDKFVRDLEIRLNQRDFPPSASFPVLSNFMGHKKNGKTKEVRSDLAQRFPEMGESDSDDVRQNGVKEGKLKEAKPNGDGSDNQESENGTESCQGDVEGRNNPPVMPFELKALEVCLESICTFMDSCTTQLEGTAFPAVDDLTLHVNTKNLQRVRAVKSKIAQHKTRVETIKEIFEKFLDDDDDMGDMNLTAKELAHRSSSPSFDLVARPDPFGSIHRDGRTQLPSSPKPSSSSSSNSSDVDEAVQEVEMLLEAYFMQIDNVFNRLLTLSEYIDDTEDYINIVQDKHRNQLLQLELIITTGTFALTIVAVVSGIFGMNLDNTFSSESPAPFILVTCLSLLLATLILITILWYCRRRGLMAI